MGKISIFRLSLESDTKTTTDRIDFNTSVNTKVENAFITGFKDDAIDGIGNNQGAEQELGDLQALGPIEYSIKLSGFISKRNGDNDDGNNQILTLLTLWNNEPKINDDWPLGRFGIEDTDDTTHGLIPVRTGNEHISLLWEKLERNTDFKGNRESFTLWFRINRGDGT
jgi:hypothetical protein